MPRLLVDYFVLDTLVNDIESLEDILRMLNSDTVLGWRDQHPSPFTRGEIIPSLIRAIQRGDIEACVWDESAHALVDAGSMVVPSGGSDEFWFRITPRGRIAHQSWEPPSSPSSS